MKPFVIIKLSALMWLQLPEFKNEFKQQQNF